MKKLVLKIINKLNYKGSKLEKPVFFPDMEKAFVTLAKKCTPYTMTSIERLYALYKSTEYVINNDINGDFVECGVWKGGSAMMVALSLLKNNRHGKKIYLYDTYEGMSEPTENDIDYSNLKAKSKYIEKINSESGSD
jgi:hypothetical protein